MAQPIFFDLDNRYECVSKLSDPLKVLDQSIRLSCSVDSIGTSNTKVCLHVKVNSLMPAFSRFLDNV
jgi:hypothetical protein